MIYVGLWLVLGVIVFAVAVWINPDAYDTSSDSWSGRGDEVLVKTSFTIVAWPLAILYYVVNTFRKALLRSKKEKLKARDEIEKELVLARREVDDLLRGVRR